MDIRRPDFTKQGQGLGKNSVAVKGAPVAFGSEFLGLTVAARTAVLNTQALQAGYRTPYYIDEIRMTAWTDEAPMGFAEASALGYSLRAQFQTGKHAFSKTPVPIGLYAPTFIRSGYATLYNDGVVYTTRGVVEVRWPLPRPLYMEPGDVIQCALDRSPTKNIVDPYTVNNFSVVYVGRALAPGVLSPAHKHVPWVAYYDHPTTATSVYSNAGEAYRNPFTVPINVHRFVQRTYLRQDAGADTNYNETMACRSPTDRFIASGGILTESSYASIRMDDSLGYAVVKEFTPIGEVMDMARQAWTFSRPLGPREQFNVAFSSSPLDHSASVDYNTLLAMIAYREEGI